MNPSIFDTEQPVAFVTGSGARRVGQVIARHLAERGYTVVLHAHRSIEEVKATTAGWLAEGLRASYVTGSVDDPDNASKWCDEIHTRHGGLHVLVNTAAVWEPTTLDALSHEALLEQWRVNLMGPALLCRAAGLVMVGQAGGGAIVNVGDWALVRPYADFAAYLLSKGSIDTLTRTMAVELAQRNPRIRVNSILPGPVMLDERISPQDRLQIVQQSLLKREGTPQDVAQAVEFLVESPFITGVCLPVDGGRTIFAGSSGDIAAHPTYSK